MKKQTKEKLEKIILTVFILGTIIAMIYLMFIFPPEQANLLDIECEETFGENYSSVLWNKAELCCEDVIYVFKNKDGRYSTDDIYVKCKYEV